MFGLTAQGQIITLTSALLNGDAQTVLRELGELSRHGKDLARLLSDLLRHFRNLLIYQVAGGDLSVLEVSEAEVASLKEQSSQVTTEAITRIMEVLSDAEGRLRDATSKKIFLEVTLLKAMQARNSVSIDTVLKQLNELRSEGGAPAPRSRPVSAAPKASPVSAKPAASPAPARSSASAAAPSIAASPLKETAERAGAAVDLVQLWQTVLEAVGRVSAFTRSYLLEARPLSFEKQVLTLGYDPEFSDQLELVNTPKTQALLQTKLQEQGHPGVQVKFVKAESPAPGSVPDSEPAASAPTLVPPAAPAPRASAPQAVPAPAAAAQSQPAKPVPEKISTEEFKNDALIQKALEIFKGQIVEARS